MPCPFRCSLALLSALAACGGVSPSDGPGESPTSRAKPAALAASDVACAQPTLRQLLVIEDHRRGDDPALVRALGSRSPEIVARAILAIGRIGVAPLAGAVADKLVHPDPEVRRTAAFALSLLRNPETLATVSARIASETDATVRAELYRALGQLGNGATFSLFRAALDTEPDPAALAAAAMATYRLLLSASASAPREVLDRLTVLVSSPAPVGVAAARALSAFGGSVTLLSEFNLLAALAQAEPEAAALLLRTLRRLPSIAVRAQLVARLSAHEPAAVRIEAASALVRQPTWDGDLARAMLTLATDTEPAVASQGLTVLASRGGLDAAGIMELTAFFDHAPSPALRRDAFVVLAKWAATPELVYTAADSGDPLLERAAVPYLLAFGDDEGPRRLVECLSSADEGVVTAALGVLLGRASISDDAKAAVVGQLARHDFVATDYVGFFVGAFGWTDAVPALLDACRQPWRTEEFLALEGCLWAFQMLEVPEALPFVEEALTHPLPEVVAAARDAYQAITGELPALDVPENQRVVEPTPDDGEIDRALRTRVTFQTEKGAFTLAMLPEAPLTAAKFVRACRRGFYDGVAFHRTVPHYVVQGGTHRGDGYGDGPLMRDEVSRVTQVRGTVGKARAGKDTPNSQFYVNVADNRHLDGAYTVFARVVDGIEIVERLEVGDRITSASLSRPRS